jgi:hypothetical protein
MVLATLVQFGGQPPHIRGRASPAQPLTTTSFVQRDEQRLDIEIARPRAVPHETRRYQKAS